MENKQFKIPVKLNLYISENGPSLRIGYQHPRIINKQIDRGIDLLNYCHSSIDFIVSSSVCPEIDTDEQIVFLYGSKRGVSDILIDKESWHMQNIFFANTYKWISSMCKLLNLHALYPSFVLGTDCRPYFALNGEVKNATT